MSENPFVPFYTSDFLGGTSGMTSATKGVYITLLCLMYETEGPLKQSWETLARRCGATFPAFKKAISILQDDGKISVSDDGIWSDKCDKHLMQRRERQNSAKAAAKKRWQKSEQKQRKADATASSPQCQPEPEPYKKEDTNVSSQKKRGTRLSEHWVLPAAWGQWALDEGWPETVVRDQAEQFKDYWISKPGQGGVKLDWLATWRNWMRNSKAPKVLTGGHHGKPAKQSDRLSAFISGARGSS